MSANILVITSSISGQQSFSTRLANGILRKLQAAHPGSAVTSRDLAQQPFPHLEADHMGAFATPATDRSPEQSEKARLSDEAVKELFEADHIIIGVPMYNFGISGYLKSWLNHIARAGITFSYAGGSPEGLLKGKKVYLAIATGGIYTSGAMKQMDFTEPYLRTVLGFLGMSDITVFRTEGMNIPELRETALPAALETVEAFAF
ncbi:FMN-dependent NADH-azoreductase [Sediminibacterium soli]|uniref:FMN-dependent NADH-azoreductase n=1 Tax=Sediminibacterium soli TaxID=2698829 RepID=UPI00137A5CDE|nr:NAD(P)H-dependent oxidoreductase [Sediminibacterium soli]NCI47274.1 FMN-dependent NADH-azoreductase [Sediminibacterium soli]